MFHYIFAWTKKNLHKNFVKFNTLKKIICYIFFWNFVEILISMCFLSIQKFEKIIFLNKLRRKIIFLYKAVALTQLCCHLRSFKRAVSFCDSKTTILGVNSSITPISSDIIEGKNLLKCLHVLPKQVVLQWIPGHCGVSGNELADYLAKQGASIIQTYYSFWQY